MSAFKLKSRVLMLPYLEGNTLERLGFTGATKLAPVGFHVIHQKLLRQSSITDNRYFRSITDLILQDSDFNFFDLSF